MSAGRRLGRVTRSLTLSLWLGLCFAPSFVVAQEAAAPATAFAALVVRPAGEQIFDITTGRTELPAGGEVVDDATGVRLVAPYIVYAEGELLEASDAQVSGSFGHLRADLLSIDIPAGLLRASGALRLERESLSLSADSVRYDAGIEIARFVGPIVGTDPDFEAAGLLLDTLDGTVLLLGPYSFREGPLTLTSTREGGMLELAFELVDGQPQYRAATEVAPETLARFADHLP